MEAAQLETIVDYASRFLGRHPCSELQDLYKRLFQAFHGSEHAISDHQKAREWLLSEWEAVGNWKAEEVSRVMEAIHIEGVTPKLYLVHLAPARTLGIDPEIILQEFLRTAECFPKDSLLNGGSLQDDFVESWRIVGRAISAGLINRIILSACAYGELSLELEKAGWPAMHHSETFRAAYSPHYRLVLDPSRVIS